MCHRRPQRGILGDAVGVEVEVGGTVGIDAEAEAGGEVAVVDHGVDADVAHDHDLLMVRMIIGLKLRDARAA